MMTTMIDTKMIIQTITNVCVVEIYNNQVRIAIIVAGQLLVNLFRITVFKHTPIFFKPESKN